jgi:hypothetical protein
MRARRNLVVIRAGDDPYCRRWIDLSRHVRNWDCFVNCYGKGATSTSIGQELTFRHGITKFFGIAEFLDESPDILEQYDAFLFLDDDIAIDSAQINMFFDLFHQHSLMLAQPSLHPRSFFNHHVTIRQPRYVLRYTGFVEIMMPAFSRVALTLCLPTFRMSVSGWGLDYLWPLRLSAPADKVAIVDAVAVRHTKRSDPKQGEFYRMLRQRNIDPHTELDNILLAHNINASSRHRVSGGLRRPNIWQRALNRA